LQANARACLPGARANEVLCDDIFEDSARGFEAYGVRVRNVVANDLQVRAVCAKTAGADEEVVFSAST